jgi:hypothetical protein
MRIRTNIEAGKLAVNHNQQVKGDRSKARGLKVRTHLKAGGNVFQHNQTVAHGLRVKSNLKAGTRGGCDEFGCGGNHNQTIRRG